MICVSEMEMTIIIDILKKYLPKVEVRTFGSRYKERNKEYSDLDLTIVSNGKMSLQEIRELKEAFEDSDLTFCVDFFDYNDLSVEFKKIVDGGYEVVLNGDGWKNTLLGEVLNFRRGHDLPNIKMLCGNIPIVASNGIIGYHNESTTKNPCVTIGRSGNIGTPYYYAYDCWAYNTTLYIDNFKGNFPKYVFYLLKTLNLSKYSVGTVIPTLNRKLIHSLQVYYTSKKNEQQAIAATLSCLDDKIELNNRTNKTLEEMAQAIFKQWFVYFEFPNENGEHYKSSGGAMIECELGLIPEGWRIGAIEEIANVYNGYAFKSKDLLSENIGNCYHVFKMGQIKKGGGFNYDTTKSYVLKENSNQLLHYILKKGDLLMCMTDMNANAALLGHTALMNEDNKYIVNHRVGLIRLNNNCGVGYPYLYILTNSKDFIEDLRQRANSGVQVNLPFSEIEKSKMIIATSSINKLFDSTIVKVYEKIFSMISENQTLTSLRDTLLPKLMSGEIRVPIKELLNKV